MEIAIHSIRIIPTKVIQIKMSFVSIEVFIKFPKMEFLGKKLRFVLKTHPTNIPLIKADVSKIILTNRFNELSRANTEAKLILTKLRVPPALPGWQ